MSTSTLLADAVALGARRIYVLATQNPGDRGLPRPPRAALAAVVHAVTVLTNARCSLMAGLVSDRHPIQAIRRPAPEILARSRYRAKRPSGRADPAMPVWALHRNDFPVATRPRTWGWVTSRCPANHRNRVAAVHLDGR
jgi:hypothetical protein